VPVFWQDNFMSLLPHETRVVTAGFSARVQKPILTLRGWNTR
jgi:hypothetical protein